MNTTNKTLQARNEKNQILGTFITDSTVTAREVAQWTIKLARTFKMRITDVQVFDGATRVL